MLPLDIFPSDQAIVKPSPKKCGAIDVNFFVQSRWPFIVSGNIQETLTFVRANPHTLVDAMGVERFIGANFRVFLTDDRILDGTLTVIDPFGNLLLNDVYETSRDRLNPSSDHVRLIGLVSVPRNTVSLVKVTKLTYKEISRGA